MVAFHEINSSLTYTVSQETQETLNSITEARETGSEAAAAASVQLADEEAATLFISSAGRTAALTKMESVSISTYGYDTEFDSISKSFKESVNTSSIGVSSGTGIDYKSLDYSVIDRMNEKYEELKSDIESNYTGEEQTDRLSELDRAYEAILKKNILNPVKSQVLSALTLYHRGGTTVWHDYSSQSAVDALNNTNAQMNAVYEKLKPAGESMKALSSASLETWLNSDYMKNTLQDIISTLILNTGTSAQIKEYQSL